METDFVIPRLKYRLAVRPGGHHRGSLLSKTSGPRADLGREHEARDPSGSWHPEVPRDPDVPTSGVHDLESIRRVSGAFPIRCSDRLDPRMVVAG